MRAFQVLPLLLSSASAAPAGEGFPGLPIDHAPVELSPTLTIAEIDRMVANERQRLEQEVNREQAPDQADSGPVPELPPGRITVSEGITTAIPVGLGHVNRLQTPFASFRVLHQSNATLSKQGQALYVTPVDARPLTLFIEDKRPPHKAIGVLLRPHPDLPPIQVALELDGVAATAPATGRSGGGHVDQVSELLRRIARGELPPGFMRHPAHGADTPDCRWPGLVIEPIAVVSNRDYRILLTRVRNDTAMALAFDESRCADEQSIAAATFPEQWIVPGGMVSMMLVRANSRGPTP